MPSKQEQALEQLTTINGQISRVISTVVSGSKSIAAQNSTVVSGVFGGFSGLTMAYLVTSFVATLSFPIFGPLLTGLGIAAGVLAFRRSATMSVETDAAKRQIAHDENEQIAKTILLRIQKLPRTAPPHIRDGLWDDYRIVTKELALLASPAERRGAKLPTGTPLSLEPQIQGAEALP